MAAAEVPTEPERLLAEADRILLLRFVSHYPLDERYNDVLNSVTTRLLKASDPKDKLDQVRLSVHFSDLGLNAITLHRVVIVDSLLLDTLCLYSQGIALYGTASNAYTDKLVDQVAALYRQERLGVLRPDLDPKNPYAIYPPSGLDQVAAKRAEPIFEGLLAAWIGHEFGHVAKQHARRRLLEGNQLIGQLASNPDDEAIQAFVRRQLDYNLGPPSEIEADHFGYNLCKKAHYPVESLRRVLLLLHRLQERQPDGLQVNRTHPSPRQRYQHVYQQRHL